MAAGTNPASSNVTRPLRSIVLGGVVSEGKGQLGGVVSNTRLTEMKLKSWVSQVVSYEFHQRLHCNGGEEHILQQVEMEE